MAVYMDNARNEYRRMKMCHMIADTLQELHDTAQAIGMLREWFQPHSFPHYDVSLTRRKQALALGAVELTSRQLALKIRELRQTPEYAPPPDWSLSSEIRASSPESVSATAAIISQFEMEHRRETIDMDDAAMRVLQIYFPFIEDQR